MKVALQLYSVRDEAEKNFEQALKAVSEFGYDGVEFAGLFGKTPNEVKALCEKYGLNPLSAHVSVGEMLEDKNVFSDYKATGCEFVAVPYIAPDEVSSPNARQKTISTVRTLSEKATAAGLKMLYHNHAHELFKIDGKSFLDELYSAVPRDLLSPEFDVCWLHFAGEDPIVWLERYSDSAKVIHLKDYCLPESSERPSFRPLGNGIMNIPAVVDAAKNIGAEWLVVEQDDPTEGERTLDEARRSVEYLRAIGL